MTGGGRRRPEATGGDRRRPEVTGGDRRRSPSKTTALLIPMNNKNSTIHCRLIATASVVMCERETDCDVRWVQPPASGHQPPK